MQRNKGCHGETQSPVRSTVQWPIDTAFDLWQLSTPQRQKALGGAKQAWCPPQEGWNKCNTDGALYPEQGRERRGLSFEELRGPAGDGCSGTPVAWML